MGPQQIRTSAAHPHTYKKPPYGSNLENYLFISFQAADPFLRAGQKTAAHTHIHSHQSPSEQREINSQSATTDKSVVGIRASPLIKRRVHFRLFPPRCPISGDLFTHCFDSNEVKWCKILDSQPAEKSSSRHVLSTKNRGGARTRTKSSVCVRERVSAEKATTEAKWFFRDTTRSHGRGVCFLALSQWGSSSHHHHHGQIKRALAGKKSYKLAAADDIKLLLKLLGPAVCRGCWIWLWFGRTFCLYLCHFWTRFVRLKSASLFAFMFVCRPTFTPSSRACSLYLQAAAPLVRKWWNENCESSIFQIITGRVYCSSAKIEAETTLKISSRYQFC